MKNKEEYHKCNVKEGFCPTLEQFTQSDRHTKGFSWFNIFDHENGTTKIKTIGVVYKENTKSNGILLNYCPFCGEDLHPFRAEYVKKEAQ
jgi:hypothetical protein